MGWQDDQLVKSKQKWESDPIVSPAPSVSVDAPMIDIGMGSAVPALIAPSDNPYSAGRYPLGRKFSVGDKAVFRITDPISGVETDMQRWKVTRVDADADLIEINDGIVILDSMGNMLRNRKGSMDVPQQIFPAELFIGKKWAAGWKFLHEDGSSRIYSYDFRITTFEKMHVAAGEFQAFRIEGNGFEIRSGEPKKNGNIEFRAWVVPGINFALRKNIITRRRNGKFGKTESSELVSLRQQSIDTDCTIPAGIGQRNFIIKSSCS